MWVWQQTTVVNTVSASLERTAKFSTQNVVRQRGRPRFGARFANIWKKPEAQKNINNHDTGACCPCFHVTSSSSSQDGNTEHGINPNFLAILVRFIYKSHDFFGNVNKKKCKVSMKCQKKNTNKMLSESLIKKIDLVGPYKLVLYRVSQKKSFLRLAPFPI